MRKGVVLFGWVVLAWAALWSHPGKAQQQIFVKEPEPIRPTGLREYSSDTIIVKFKRGVGRSGADGLHQRFGATRLYTSPHIGFDRVRVPPSKAPDQLVQLYRQNPNVEYAERDPVMRTTMMPNDPFYGYQWHFGSVSQGGVSVQNAWDITTGASYVVVAVVDTGVAYENYAIYSRAPDLAQTYFVPGYDFVNGDSHPNDDNGHGTHVAGTVAQSTNNGIGVTGIAFNGAVMPVKVLNSNGSGFASAVADGIQFAADNGANVINLSLGGGASQTLRNACEYARDRGVTLVCAAGNDGAAQISYPAAYDSCCIAVGATRFDKTRSYYSNYGPGLDVVAPGGDVTVDQNNDGYVDGVLQQTFGNNPNDWGYWFWQGTSMATPHVSGVAALLLASGVATTPADVRVALQSTATDLGAPNYDEQYGWGLINAVSALNFTNTPNTVPEADPGGPYSGTEDAAVTFNGSGSSDDDGDTLTYAWDFGDGNTGSGVSVAHTYAAGGLYTVTLVVNDGTEDSAPAQTTADIADVNDPPVADAGGPYAGATGSEIQFDGSGSYDVDQNDLSYEWDFGDGTTGAGVAPTHVYALPGPYTANLRVWDGWEWSPGASAAVNVTDGGSEVELFYDSFEIGEWNSLWVEDSQQDWFRSTQRSTQGSYSAEVDGGAADAALTSIPINLQGHSNATVTFSWYIESGLDTGEYLAFDVSPDNSNWDQKAILRGNQDAENTWHAVQVDLDTAGWQQLYIRFRGRMSRSDEDANVDDVKVVANGGEGTAQVNNPPVADAGGPYAGAMGSEIQFDGSGSYDVDQNDTLSYEWDFGDGTTGAGMAPTHVYAEAGTYTATLVVTDNGAPPLFSQAGAAVNVTGGGSEAELFYDSFENGEWNGLWVEDSQQDWFDSTQRSTQGSYSAEVDGGAADAALTSNPIDLQGHSNATVTFSWYIESGLDTGEYLAFDVSTDGGSTWTQQAILRGNVDAENTWHAVQVELSGIASGSISIRFRGSMSRSSEDANVDEVRVVSN